MTKRSVAGLTLSLLVAFFAGSGDGSASGAGDSVRHITAALGEHFASLERAVADRDAGLAAQAVPRLKQAVRDLDEAAGELSNDARMDTTPHTSAIAAGCDALSEAVAREEWRRGDELIHDVRARCVSCHVKYRTPVDGRWRFYPAVENTVAGKVEVHGVNGAVNHDPSDVVVFLDGGPEASFPRPSAPAVLTQRDTEFIPEILTVRKGTQVLFPNEDVLYHNVFSLSKTKPFDLGIYQPGESKMVTFDTPGLVKVYCNIHSSMEASILVLNNPWFAKTDGAGEFVITEVPDGDYVLRTWTRLGGDTRQDVRVEGSQLFRYELTVWEDKRPTAHLNKFGETYESKY